MSNHELESTKLKYQNIKNHFDTYEERRNKMVANNYELLRSQVEPGYTPKYVSGAYLKPEVVAQKNIVVRSEDDTDWRMWFINLEESSGSVNVSVDVTLEGGSTETLTATGLDTSVDYSDFLSNFIAAVSPSSITIEKRCDSCIVLDGIDEEITNISATLS